MLWCCIMVLEFFLVKNLRRGGCFVAVVLNCVYMYGGLAL